MGLNAREIEQLDVLFHEMCTKKAILSMVNCSREGLSCSRKSEDWANSPTDHEELARICVDICKSLQRWTYRSDSMPTCLVLKGSSYTCVCV